jgi:hypothetical protein
MAEIIARIGLNHKIELTLDGSRTLPGTDPMTPQESGFLARGILSLRRRCPRAECTIPRNHRGGCPFASDDLGGRIIQHHRRAGSHYFRSLWYPTNLRNAHTRRCRAGSRTCCARRRNRTSWASARYGALKNTIGGGFS